MDLDIISHWKHIKNMKCPGCGRPITQHLHNESLGREETPEDYNVWSIDCPAAKAVSEGQETWRQENKGAIELYSKGKASDPSAGIYWLAQGNNEVLPIPDMN